MRHTFVLPPAVIALLAVVACGGPGDGVDRAAPAPVRATVIGATVLSSDGIPLAYDARGHGDAALVFIHCWACDRSLWSEQVAAFAGDYRVVTIDLAGHGDSGTSRAAWSIAGLGDDVRAVVEELGLERVVLVGHSMGGPVALAAAARLPGRVEGIVCVDTLHDLDAKMPEEMSAQLLVRFSADFDGAMREIAPLMFREQSDPAVIERVATMATDAPEGPAMALFADFPRLDLPAMMREAGVPVRCINATPLPPMSPATDIEGNRQYGDFDAELIEGVGHYVMLEKPAEFDAALRRALGEILQAE